MAKELCNWLVNHLHDRALEKCAVAYLRGTLVDIGCGTKPYRSILARYVTRHVGIDHSDSPHGILSTDVIGTAYALPLLNATADSVVCTAVLEHLEEPERALRECYRILKPGGMAVYSVPFIWHVHEAPRDFYRFSWYGLRYLFSAAGFELVDIRALSGFWATFGQLLVYNIYRYRRGPLRWLGVIDALGIVIQAGAYLLDRVDRAEDWTWMYMVVARKQASPDG